MGPLGLKLDQSFSLGRERDWWSECGRLPVPRWRG